MNRRPRSTTLLCVAAVWLISHAACAHHGDMKDKVVVITGASSGFGKGVAQ